MTKAYKDMCNLYSPVEALFFEEFVDTEQWNDLEISKMKHDEMTVPMSDMFDMYERFCKKHRFLKDESKATSSRTFASRLTELEFPITKYKAHGTNSFKFTPSEVYEHIDKRKWINGYKDDEDEMMYVDEGEDPEGGYIE